MKLLALILALIIGSASTGDAGKPTKTNFYYDIQWGHLIIGHISVSLEKKSNSIKLKVKSKSEGPISLLYNYESDLVASSYKDGETWRPNSYVVKSSVKNNQYYSKVSWDKKTNKLNYKIDPPLDLKKVFDVPQSTLKNVIDPITAIIKVVEKINRDKPCDTELHIFDGRRRYDLSTKELEKQYLINDRPRSYKGDAVVCGIKITPIGGNRIESKWEPENDKFSDIKIFFSTAAKGLPLPVRMKLDRWFGTITFRLLKHN